MITYGKLNPVKRTYYEIKSAFRISPYTENYLKKYDLKPYLPKISKLKLALGLIAFSILLITPFTPEFLIAPIIAGWIFR